MTSPATTLATSVIEAGDFGMVVLDGDRRVVLWNRWMAEASGLAAEAVEGRVLFELFPEFLETRLEQAVADALGSGLSSRLSHGLNEHLFPLAPRQGEAGETTMSQTLAVGPLHAGEAKHCFIQVTDVTNAARRERQLRQQALGMEALAENYRLSELRTRAILENALDPILTVDDRGRISSVNPEAERVFGYDAREMLQKTVGLLIPECGVSVDDDLERRETFWRSLAGKRESRGCVGLRKDGTPVELEINIGEMELEGKATFVVMARDVTHRKQAEERIHYLAHYDPLTGAANRVLFQERLDQAVIQARRTESPFALMLLDLDRFKDVNDTLGHQVGDKLLVDCAERIRGAIRESDTLARLGGDEFAVVLTNLLGPDGAGTVAEAIVATLAEPFDIDDTEVKTSASVGITLFPTDAEDSDDLMRNADLALYRAKARGRDTWQFYVPEMDALVQAHKSMERDLRSALEAGDLGLDYQPLVRVADGRITGAEALVRWNRGEQGRVSADTFVPILQRSDLILPIGRWVLEQACTQVATWRAEGNDLKLAVNLSGPELIHPDLVPSVIEVLGQTRLAPDRLQLEISEESFLQVVERSPEVLRRLREQGVRVCIDDFGTGVSCLDHLKRHPIDQIKIAPIFLARVAATRRGGPLYEALVALGHGLGVQVDVEGVETPDQLEFLKGVAVGDAQGYLLGRPVGAEDFLARVRAGMLEEALPPS